MSVDTFDPASLESFLADLVRRGFEPILNSDRRWWTGPIHPAFAALTDAQTMRLCILDGWPYEPPALLVDGLHTNHSTLDGLVCLWREGDASLQWITVDGLFGKVLEWCADAESGWAERDLGRDAYLNFSKKLPVLATFDFTELRTNVGAWGTFSAKWERERLVTLSAGRTAASDALSGLWFRTGALAVPPRNLQELQSSLSRAQMKGLRRGLAERKGAEPLRPSGGVDLVLLAWSRGEQIHLLVLALEGKGDEIVAWALELGPNDEENLLLRAGPDSAILRDARVVVLGCGALGGFTALTLAESGVGYLRLLDRGILSPGNVVRHVAGHKAVGTLKVNAVNDLVKDHAPWTVVDVITESPTKPADILKYIEDVDLVVDATGNETTSLALAVATRQIGKPLVSAALYRGGFVARMRRQAREDDCPLDQRFDLKAYPVIPPDPEGADAALADIGCSAPVNNAPPASVIGCASTLVHAAVDVLSGRYQLLDEVIDVYRPVVNSPPFDKVGRVTLLHP